MAISLSRNLLRCRIVSDPCRVGLIRCYAAKPAVDIMNEILGETLSSIKAAGTWKAERVITTKQAAAIQVLGSKKKILNFCANNYLGLSSHPEVIEASKKALDKYGEYGAGLSSVRFICGTQDIHKELESKIAKFHNRDDAILYASCFDANAGIFDAQSHHLEKKLAASNARMKLIATDGAFSMDGNYAPLKEICDLGDKYGALVFVDECHATGFLGNTGRGTDEFLNVFGRPQIINSTLGKALGGAAGGYTCGPQSLIDLLRQKSRPYLFSNSVPPPVVAGASKVFDLLMNDSSLVEKVASKTKRFREKMTAAGFTLWGEGHPICPIMLGDAALATKFADEMLKHDIYVIGFSFPVVPKGKARIRVQISAAHSDAEIDQAVEAFTLVGKQLGVI
ncbi:2-amino-3-ketobutyrate coenzyme A ligase, mitochondrial-like [Saccoglossus kowalevskii]|uniref:2-amino-3-ketobutyrate coenzyme A ligase, mitochondrial-like n=1 Tax=Saccoglossus kowalevskii TaxID=10224 RepID=A0ABM0M1U3_SACKO|nr:PREDICTED: 2-amino-3-ketobutyrate coenzyme A ligase, mitochondrial-like [Saccoglossus kowalevskii]